MNKKIYKKFDVEKISIIFLFFSIFLGSFYFILNLLVLFLIVSNKKDLNVSKSNLKLINFLPAYLLLFIFQEAYRNQNLLFWDNQYLIHLFNCNYNSKFRYFLKFNNQFYSCKETLGFGIIEDFLALRIDPWYFSLVFILILFSFLMYLVQKFEPNQKMLFIIFLCTPSFVLLLSSLNLDLVFFIYLTYIISTKKQNFNFFDFIFITIYSQLKIYGFGIFFGLLFLHLLKRKINKYPMLIIFSIFNLGLFVYGSLVRDQSTFPNEIFGIPYVYAPLYSFGFLADIMTYIDVQLSPIQNKYLLIVCIVFFISFLLYFKNKVSFENSKLEKTSKDLLIILFPLFALINLFGNSGYKYVFNFLIVFLLFPGLNKTAKVLLSLSFFLIPLYPILNLNNSHEIYEATYLNSLAWMISRTYFYYFFLYYLKIFWESSLRAITKNY
tara:strand:- start:479 stop:1795 length:1317 start_codon:yes stop_codon:yes gene_type:complete